MVGNESLEKFDTVNAADSQSVGSDNSIVFC